ncbi:YHS domain-containing protein [Pedobacter sp. ISL-68]|uniref:YHS domain-containing protein n=1 Tax=unclassified Pedobacter TaxID=2628915 RepID=UPI001BE54D9D|nr:MULTISPECIES: YHS domain-containing protein [unclassified Pedobacter]MBT2562060.1 YHS domain-containing protein [Pedobacter sp. ISL-64]MBT2591647.1 YHS domain-containing protein [Pedobacter sp. ISL-68]
MKKLNFAIILIGLTTLSLKSNATPVINGSKTRPIDSAKKATVDPVCKMKVKAQTAKNTVYNRVTYSFCSESCKQKFVAEPAKYLKK